MSSIDDILFEPIGSGSKAVVDQNLIDYVKKAVAGYCNVEFWINQCTAFETYEQIANLIENDPGIITYTQQMVTQDASLRPAKALSLIDIFRLIYDNGDSTFYMAGKSLGGQPIRDIRISNWFAVEDRIPILYLPGYDYFEMWVLGVMSNFAGYTGFYLFADEQDARAYYGMP